MPIGVTPGHRLQWPFVALLACAKSLLATGCSVMDDSDLQDARDDDDDDDDEGPIQLSIDRVTRVSLSKLRFSRFDPQLVKVITGKGMNRHAKRSVGIGCPMVGGY